VRDSDSKSKLRREVTALVAETEALFATLEDLDTASREAFSEWRLSQRKDLWDRRNDLLAQARGVFLALGPLIQRAAVCLRTAEFWHPGGFPARLDNDVLPLLPDPHEYVGPEDVFPFLTALRSLLVEAAAAAAGSPSTQESPWVPPLAPGKPLAPDHAPAGNGQPYSAVKSCADPGIAVKPILMTPAQAAAYLSLTEKAVRHQIADGQLPIVRRGRRVFINTKELDRLIAANTELPSVLPH